tara:strand:- start:61 stop:303 length:243 start_codon:yes stop_codon:yes gene_type:complete
MGIEAPKELLNQPIVGYRQLSQQEIDLINSIKMQGLEIGALVARVREVSGIDQRWASIGATDLQTGLMALTRAVAKPGGF